MKEGRVVKGIKFANLRDAGDPVECAKAYQAAGFQIGAEHLFIVGQTQTPFGRLQEAGQILHGQRAKRLLENGAQIDQRVDVV